MKSFTTRCLWAVSTCVLICNAVYAQHKPVKKTKPKTAINAGASFNGTIPAQMAVNANGALTYTVTLNMPPGINGVQPSLQLLYNSQGSNGYTGMGFSLSGLSAITRAGATVPEDGFRGGINYDGNDRFVFNGSRMMVASATGSNYFSAGNTYYPEMQDWSKIVANGSSGQGPSSFTVYLKDGSIAQYGNGNGSQVLAQGPVFNSGSQQGSVRTWLISSIADACGNTINYFYTATPKNMQGIPIAACANDGTGYPDAVYYTSNGTSTANRKIQFLWEARNDTLLQYAGGASNRVSVRLKAVQTFIINGTDTSNIATYMLTYEGTSPLGVSRLSSIAQLGSAGGSSQPLSFTWTNGANGLTGSTFSWSGPASNAGFEGDFNGDGKTDLLPSTNNMVNTIYYAGNNGFTAQSLGTSILVTPTTYVADYNGDGYPDLLVIRPGGTGQLYLCNGQTFNSSIHISGLQYNNSGYGNWTADFNGDGMADLFSVMGSAGYMYLSNGNGFDTVKTAAGLSLQQLSQTFVADFNGDGQADIFYGSSGGGSLYLSDFSHTGSFQPVISVGGMTISNTLQNNMVADYNSDGLADVLTHINNQYNLYYSNGHGFDNPVAITNVNLNITQNWLSDFNGDGTMDFYALAGTSATLYYYYGNKFQPQTNSSPAFIAGSTWSGDFNGDGIADLFSANTKTIYYGTNTAIQPVPTVNQVPNLLTGINNGINGTAAVNYKPITDATVYQPAGGNNGLIDGLHVQNKYGSLALSPTQVNPYPFVRTQSALYVVQQQLVNDGLGDTYPYYYNYKGSLEDMQAYGWLGFQQVTTTDSGGQNIFNTSYLQVYPYTGSMLTVQKLNLSGSMLSQQRNYYGVIADTLTPLQSYVYKVVKTSTRTDHYDYGNFAYTTGLNYKYDSYGNTLAKAQLDDTAENNIIYTLNQYINDTVGWHIGYMQSSKESSDSLGLNLLQQAAYQYAPNTWLQTGVSYWLNTNNSWLNYTYSFDAYGNNTLKVDEAGDSTVFVYDSVYHTFVTSQTSPADQWGTKLVNTMTYNPATGSVAISVDPNGNTTQVLSDQFGRDSLIIGPDSTGSQLVPLSQVLYYLNGTGYTEQHIVRNNWAGTNWDTAEITYDGLNRKYQQTWRGQNHQMVTQQQTYNSNNKVTWQSLPFFDQQQQQGTVFQYDPYQRIISTTLPGPSNQNIVNQYSYLGKQVTVHNAVGTADSTTSYRSFDFFNGRRKYVQRMDETGLVSNFHYDLLARITNITDPSGFVTSFTYNSLNDTIQATNPSSGTKNILFNYPARTFSIVNNTGDTITTSMDALMRKTSVTSPTANLYYQYDVGGVANGLGKLCRTIVQDTGVSYTYTYNAANQQTSTTVHVAGNNYTQGFSFNADRTNNSIIYPDNSVAQYSYYNNGYLQQVNMADALAGNTSNMYVTYNQYDAAGNQQVVSYGNGVQRTAAFNSFGNLNNYQITGPGSQPLTNKYYNWNFVNNVTGIIDSLNGNNSAYYSYTTNGRLYTAQGPYGQMIYTYDSSGNLKTNDSTTFQYNNYQVTNGYKGNTPLFADIYDGNGNLAQRTAYQGQDSVQTKYVFNTFNQLTGIISGSDTLFTFTYGANGQRLIKKNYALGVTTLYISPQYNVTVTTDSIFYTKYVCAPNNFVASVIHGASIAAPGSYTNLATYLHQDFVNSTTLVTNTTGALAAQVIYTPFGQPYSIQGADTAAYLFGSKELDGSGLYYFGSRYYDALTAHFISADNMPGGGMLQTDAFNRYTYTLNNPVKYYDANGHIAGVTALALLLQGLVAFLTDGAAIPEEVAADAVIAEEETGADFMNALARANHAGAIDDEQSFRVYRAVRDVIAENNPAERFNAGYPDAWRPINHGYVGMTTPGQDNFGNVFYSNTQSANLEKELATAEQRFANGTAARYTEYEEIGQRLNTGESYKFVLSFDDYSLKIGTDNISHAAVEGNGEYAYTAGYAQVNNDGDLEISNRSGHYRPSMNSLRVSAPLWQMLKDAGMLDFNNIVYVNF